MECPVCESRRWATGGVCASCINACLATRRVAIAAAAERSSRAEQALAQVLDARDRQPKRAGEDVEAEMARHTRRLRVDAMRAAIQQQQAHIDKVTTQVTALRADNTSRARNLSASRAILTQLIRDLRVSPAELKSMQAQVAAAASVSPPGGSTVDSPAIAALKRRVQSNPLFTANLRRFLAQLESKLARYRLCFLEDLLHIYPLRRKSAGSCSIVGLELPDDPELLFSAKPPPEAGAAVASAHAHATPHADSHSHVADLDSEVVSAALGYSVLLLSMICSYIDLRLPYPMRFHGSHSSVGSEGDDARFFLMPDAAQPNHFRRALTLLHHNIQFAFEQTMRARGGREAQLQLQPLHTLPNLLKLIEAVMLSLRTAQNESAMVEQERRLAQARSLVANRTSAAAAVPSATDFNFVARSGGPNSSATSTAASSSAAAAPAPDADSFAPALGRLGLGAPLLSRQDSSSFFMYGEAGEARLQRAIAALPSPRSSPYSSPQSSPQRGERAFSHPSDSASEPSEREMLSSRFFDLPPNGYLAQQEPRDSMLLSKSQAQSLLALQQRPSSTSSQFRPQLQQGAPIVTHTPAASVASQLARASAASNSASSSPSGIVASSSSAAAAVAAAAASLAATTSSPRSLAARLWQQAQSSLSHSPSAASKAPSLTSSLTGASPASGSTTLLLPAVSYASEGDIEWDVVDVINDEAETELNAQPLYRQHAADSAANATNTHRN